METSIQTFIDMCQWDTSKFLIFSNNVFGTLIYYSHFLALILALVVGLFVFLKGKNQLVNRLLSLIMFLFSLWVFFDLILWANEKDYFIMFFWSAMLIIEPLIYALCVYFIDVFIEKKDISFRKKIGIFSLLLPIIFLLPTRFSLVGFDLTNCFREPTEGIIATYYVYFIEIVYAIWILFYAAKKYRQLVSGTKKQIVLITIGVVLFLLSFVSGNIIGSITENWTMAQIGLFSMPIFVTFLAYMIVKFKTFNIKMFGAQALVFALAFLVLGIIFIRTIDNVRLVAVATLLLIIIVGYLLIQGVKKEIEQKEMLAKLNIDLEDLLKQRESLVHLVTHKVKGSFTRSKYIFAGILDGTFGPITPEIKKYAEQGLDSDNMGIETVDLVLNAANMEKGLIKYDMKVLNFRELVEQSISDKKVSIERKGLQLESNIQEGAYNVLGDAIWLKEVVNNLIENSIKYTPTGKISVNLTDGDGKIKLVIKDTGVGITEEDKKNLFTEGGRGKDSVKVNVDSTGYGLYTVKLIVETHGGKVWAESEGSGKGSTFFVELKAV
jgi:signal transduction histidine kinase